LLAIEGRLVVARVTMGEFEDVGDLIREAFLIGFPSPAIKSLICATDRDIEDLGAAGATPIKDLMEVDHKLMERLIEMIDYVPEMHGCSPKFGDPESAIVPTKGFPAFVTFDPLAPYNPTLRATRALNEEAESCAIGSWLPEPLASATCRDYLRFAKRALKEIEKQKIQPVFKMVDTCAGEFESSTPYYYGTFETEDDAVLR